MKLNLSASIKAASMTILTWPGTSSSTRDGTIIVQTVALMYSVARIRLYESRRFGGNQPLRGTHTHTPSAHVTDILYAICIISEPKQRLLWQVCEGEKAKTRVAAQAAVSLEVESAERDLCLSCMKENYMKVWGACGLKRACLLFKKRRVLWVFGILRHRASRRRRNATCRFCVFLCAWRLTVSAKCLKRRFFFLTNNRIRCLPPTSCITETFPVMYYWPVHHPEEYAEYQQLTQQIAAFLISLEFSHPLNIWWGLSFRVPDSTTSAHLYSKHMWPQWESTLNPGFVEAALSPRSYAAPQCFTPA